MGREAAAQPHVIERAARRLRDAYIGRPIASLRDCIASHDLATAYAIQNANTDFWRAGGREICGFKIGLTSKAVQAHFGIDEPDSGVLFRDRQAQNEGSISGGALIQPRVEGEIALILGHDIIDTSASAASVSNAVAWATAAIEIVDSRIADWRITAADTVADNGSAGFFTLGDDRIDPRTLDLVTCEMTLRIGDLVVSQGTGAAVLGDPMAALAWLARHLAASDRQLRAGDVVLTGTMGAQAVLPTGATASVEVMGLGSASVIWDG